MPFDALVSSPPDVLTKLGLTPVPETVLTAHKAAVTAEFFSQHRSDQERRYARWHEHGNRAFRDYYGGMFGWAEKMLGPVPAAVQAIVADTERRATERGVAIQDKIIGFFDRDPYVRIWWSDDGQAQTACLAIWDNGKVIHIAKLA